MTDIPEYDEELRCDNPVCVYVKADPITGLYGIAGGGGPGVYTVCSCCGTVLSKSIEPEESCDSHENIGNRPTPEQLNKLEAEIRDELAANVRNR